jgi:F420-non-reducing hydrogenase iron-sulfur subunit
MPEFRPKIVGFLCNWCSYAGADNAGGLRLPYSADIRLVRVMCTGRVDTQFILDAFREGADGVMVLGCHPGDCHYRDGNLKALRRNRMLSRLLPQFGIDPRRLRLDWVGAGQGDRFHKVAGEMTDTILALGPLRLPGFREAGGVG